MSIEAGIMVPHPPISIPAVGHGDEKKMMRTIKSYQRAARMIAGIRPDTIVILSPHSMLYFDYFHISPGEGAGGSMAEFQAEDVKFSVRYDTELVQEIEKIAQVSGLAAGTQGEKEPALDHGTMVPLWFLQEAYKGNFGSVRFVRVGLSAQSFQEHYRLGMVIRQAAINLGRRVAVVASGDLSHRIQADSPCGFHADGAAYDKRIMQAMEKADFGELFAFKEKFCENAAECGHRAFLILAGCFDGMTLTAEKYSYEAPFGVGYGVCTYLPKGKSERRAFFEQQQGIQARKLQERKEKEDEALKLARLALENLIVREEKISVPAGTSAELTERRAGVFVSIYRNGRLRGCVGSIDPTGNIAEEIIRSAQCAATRDTRFMPVQPNELDELRYCVDILSQPEEISGEEALDAEKYGVIISRGFKKGLLLPKLEGIDTVEQQMAAVREKAGIGAKDRVKMQRFTVERHEVPEE